MQSYCTLNSQDFEPRRFLTREEKIEMLSEYKKELELEAKGVAQRISELEKQE